MRVLSSPAQKIPRGCRGWDIKAHQRVLPYTVRHRLSNHTRRCFSLAQPHRERTSGLRLWPRQGERRFLRHGPAGLHDAPRSGRPPVLSDCRGPISMAGPRTPMAASSSCPPPTTWRSTTTRSNGPSADRQRSCRNRRCSSCITRKVQSPLSKTLRKPALSCV
jgi:hypothetical protein